jgi:hypothetical protein
MQSDIAPLRVRDWPKAVIPLEPTVMAEVQRLARANGISLSEAVRMVLADVGLAYLASTARRREAARASATPAPVPA